MRPAAAELGPLTRSTRIAILFLLVGTRAAHAQTVEPDGDRRAFAAAEIGSTRLAGSWVPLASGSLTFQLTRWIEVGGAARIGLTGPTLLRGGSRIRLHFGYAGARVSVRPLPERLTPLRLGLLVGAGNADVKDPSVGTLLDSDNGPILEPSASYDRPLLPKVTAQGEISWRMATRFRLLGDVLSRDIRGPTASIGLTIGPF